MQNRPSFFTPCCFHNLSMRLWSLFPHLLNVSWPCDLLQPTECGGINRLQEALCVSAHTLGTHALAERIKPRLACWMMRITWHSHRIAQSTASHGREVIPEEPDRSRHRSRLQKHKQAQSNQASLAHVSRTAQMTHGCLMGHNKCLLWHWYFGATCYTTITT